MDSMKMTQNGNISSTSTSRIRSLGGINTIRGFRIDSLDLQKGNRMLNALILASGDEEEEEVLLSTWSLLKTHIQRLCLVCILYIYGWIDAVLYTCSKYSDTFSSIILLEWYSSSWYNTIFVPYTALSKFIGIELLGCTADKIWYIFPNKIFDWLPQSIGLILHQNNFDNGPDVNVPQPYLNHDKKIVVPSKKEIQEAIKSRNEYLTKQRIHLAAEEIRILSEFTRFVLWVSLLPRNIKFVTIFEPKGSIWKDVKALKSLRDSLVVELSSFSTYDVGSQQKTIPRLELIDCFSGERLTLNENCKALDGNNLNPEREFKDSESKDINFQPAGNEESCLHIYLCDDRLKTLPIENFDMLPPAPDLLLAANCQWRFRTFGFLTRLSEIEFPPNKVYFFESKGSLSFKFFIRSIYYYSARNIIKSSADHSHLSDSMASINSNNFFHLFLERLRSLRLFDLNSTASNPPLTISGTD
ncbi:hypothetical protein CLIB1423_04S00276 [[Candida] railenensis]|uniref:Uncharacterized protein n=1 Tax=[Candida] railenensis TaxID=45579 RepID=A0A9P0QMP8_9ASCO|nr:hypothetical protein CLIB1423_04S00276 [[Candida] railenensis]